MQHIKRLRFALGTIVFASAAVFLTPGVSSGELDLPGINNRLNNQDARITNNEKDIKTLQASTNTEAAQDHVTVPAVAESTPTPTSAPTASPEPTPAPISDTTSPTPEPSPTPTPIPPNTSGHGITN